jgi:flap endonuclease-1
MEIEELEGRSVAVDLPNAIYRHLFQIRGADGAPYRNREGRKIGHLLGLCNEISSIARAGLRPILVFDGRTPRLKEATARQRLETGSAEKGFRLDEEMNREMKEALNALGLPWVQAPEEAEAQAAFMTMRGTWAAFTNDYDALLFGASRVVRRLSKAWADLVVLSEAQERLQLDRRHIVRIGVLMGTDYDPGGVAGVGPKRAVELVKAHGSMEEIGEELDLDDATLELFGQVEEYYMDPPVKGDWKSTWELPDREAALEYLVRRMMLGKKTVSRVIDILTEGPPSTRQTVLG